MTWIQTYTGRKFDFVHPTVDMVCIEDIAVALSRIARFVGHSLHFYSVAQHSVLTSYLVPQEFALAALLHDAAEAYLGDVSRPLKMLLPDYRGVEKRIEDVIYSKFLHQHVAYLTKQYFAQCTAIKLADNVMLATERRDIMSKCEEEWAALPEPMGDVITPLHADFALSMFCVRYKALTGTRINVYCRQCKIVSPNLPDGGVCNDCLDPIPF